MIQHAGSRATFMNAVAAELTKIWTERSARYVAGLIVVSAVLYGALFSSTAAEDYASLAAAERAAFDPTAVSLHGVVVAHQFAGLLGALTITLEYGTGMIRASLAAVPRRGQLLGAKLVAGACLTTVAGLAAAPLAFLVGQSLVAGGGAPAAAFDQQNVPRAVLGFVLYVAMISLFGAAVGVLVRRTVGVLLTVVTTTTLVPNTLTLVLGDGATPLIELWPTSAGMEIMAVHDDQSGPGPWIGFAVMCAFVAATVAAAVVTFRRRDH